MEELFKEQEAEVDALYLKGLKSIKRFGIWMSAATIMLLVTMGLVIVWLITKNELFNFISNMTMLVLWILMMVAADARAGMEHNLGYAEGMLANAKYQSKIIDTLKDNDTKNDVPKPVSSKNIKAK